MIRPLLGIKFRWCCLCHIVDISLLDSWCVCFCYRWGSLGFKFYRLVSLRLHSLRLKSLRELRPLKLWNMVFRVRFRQNILREWGGKIKIFRGPLRMIFVFGLLCFIFSFLSKIKIYTFLQCIFDLIDKDIINRNASLIILIFLYFFINFSICFRWID